MNYKGLLLFIVGLLCLSNVNAVNTPSGQEIPDSLLIYLSCPVGDNKCKDLKKKACMLHLKICQKNNPLLLDELLSKNNINNSGLSSENYCSIHTEVCEMIEKYDTPISDDDVYDYGRYYSCDSADIICKFEKISACKMVYKKCKDAYPKEDCEKLSEVCNSINKNIKPSFIKDE